MTKSALVQGAKEKAVKRIMNYSSETTYGPHPPSPDPTAEPEYSPSPEYRAIKASLDAYEMWEAMSNEERLEMILDRYPPFQWFEEQQLPTIALFRHDAIKWGRIRAKGKDCGVDVWDLEKAVDAFLKDQQTTREGQEGQGAAPDSSRSADQSVWAKAITVAEFLQQQDVEHSAYVKDLVVPGAITVVAAPRGTGKSITALALGLALATGGRFRNDVVEHKRVLLIDRDNPPAIVRGRLRQLGGTGVDDFKVLTRNEAPPLSEKAAWEMFPVHAYDVVLIDSLGAATEGISEKEGKQTQEFLATLKNLAHRGPAILALDNTNKAATSYRGRGEKADAVDILYEAREITGWTPPSGADWWERLPEAGDHAWQTRATRRKGATVLRLAFIPSKFRLGIEPEPFALEIDLRMQPWALSDITRTLTAMGEEAAKEQRRQERQKLEHAAKALDAVLQEQSPGDHVAKEAAVEILRGHGITREQARNLLQDGFNADVHPGEGRWQLRPIPGSTSHAIGVYAVGVTKHAASETPTESPREMAAKELSSLAVGQPSDGERVTPKETSNGTDFKMLSARRGPDDQRRAVAVNITSNSAGQNGVVSLAAAQPTPAAPSQNSPKSGGDDEGDDWVEV